MASTTDEHGKGTDGASIKPVSSLRSHFEALKATGISKETPAAPSDRLRLPQDIAQSYAASRTSFDLPRPYSPWSTATSRHSSRPGTPQSVDPSQSRTPPNRVQSRPMSLDLRSTPNLLPAVTVASPRSPPRTSPGSRSGSRSPERLLTTIRPGTTAFEAQSSPLVLSSSVEGNDKIGRITQVAPETTQFPARTSSIAPPIKRLEKPKIPMKPRPINQQGETLAPEPKEASIKDASPFSTPPSSEGSPSPQSQGTTNRFSGLVSAQESGSTFNGEREDQDSHSATGSQDPRQLGFSRPRGFTEEKIPKFPGPKGEPNLPSHRETETRRGSTHPDPKFLRQGSTAHGDARLAGFHAGKESHLLKYHGSQETSKPEPQVQDITRENVLPGSMEKAPTRVPLPPLRPESSNVRRRPPPPPPPAPQALRSQTHICEQPSPPLPFDRSTKPIPSLQKTQPSFAPPQREFPPPPRRTTFEQEAHRSEIYGRDQQSVQNAPVSGALYPEDSDDAEDAASGLPMTKSEYPDSSRANRRPPLFRELERDIATRFDSRVLEICGKIVCTTGYVTRAWDILSGEELLTRPHGETLKMLSIAFKPGASPAEDGQRLWVGSNIGDLQEIDLMANVVVAESKVHKPREVLQILRNKMDLWTLDEEGRLFVWRAQSSGVPSLSHGRQCSTKLPKGHTFSMAARGKLWYATGREIRVFRPDSDSSFAVLQRPLSQPGTGDVHSGSYSSRDGGRTYFGHADGRVSIYSIRDYTCLGVVKASDYKITAMCFVGDYLWAAYKTGKIYVYDVSTAAWTVKKDWQAHDGPASSLMYDRTSLHTPGLNRLQVASLGHDSRIRLWDATLADDWLEAAMQKSDIKYCTFREIRAAVITWNVGARSPLEIRKDFILDAINVDDPPELLVFGFQEIVDLEDRSVTAKSLFGFGKKKDKDNARSEQHISRVYREWRDFLSNYINRYLDSQYSYSEVHTSCLIGLFQCIFVRQEARSRIRDVSGAEVKCGLKGHYGNKGALITRFLFDDSSLCFINCHLAAGQTQTSHRNNDIAAILEAESLPIEREPTRRTSHFVGGGDGTQILDHEICILNGDLNYRIDAIPRDTVINMIKRGELDRLLERDQIMVSRRRVSGFRLSPFSEAPITFPPTYKYDVGTDNYDTSEKKRSPAWCDRLLYRSTGRIKQLEYRRHEIRVSDHRPVSGMFRMRVKTIDPGKQSAVRKECLEMFGQVSRRLAEEASIEYLVDYLGMEEGEARAQIEPS